MEIEINEGQKHDHGKLRYDLLPVDAIEEIVAVLGHGATKYGDRNWESGIKYTRIYRALLGHIWDWWMGRGNDIETGLSHLAHAGCCVLFLLAYEKRKMISFDDRGG